MPFLLLYWLNARLGRFRVAARFEPHLIQGVPKPDYSTLGDYTRGDISERRILDQLGGLAALPPLSECRTIREVSFQPEENRDLDDNFVGSAGEMRGWLPRSSRPANPTPRIQSHSGSRRVPPAPDSPREALNYALLPTERSVRLSLCRFTFLL